MTLEEIQSDDAAQRRVDRMKANAKAAADRAKQLKGQADTNAEQLKMRRSREKIAQIRKTTASTMIKPYS